MDSTSIQDINLNDEDEEYLNTEYLDENLKEIVQTLKCCTCSEEFEDIDSLTKHIVDLHYKYECSHCLKKFLTEKKLLKHLREAHLESMNLKCALCDKRFRTKYNLEQHIFIHTTIPYFSCKHESCGRKFRHISSLKQHENIHLSRNRRECPICHEFVTRLSSHILLHATHRNYSCDKCGKSYYTEKQLEKHQEIHLGIKYACTECSATYQNKSSLYKHRKTVHTQTGGYNCPTCSKNFNRLDNMRAHCRRFHDLPSKTKNVIAT